MTPAVPDEKKTDRRILKTKQALYEALMRLLRTQSVEEVSVSRLCEVANVNRSSFYKYYSTPSDILRERERRLYDLFRLEWLQCPNHSVQDAMLTQLCVVQKEQDFCRAMFGPHGMPGFLEHMGDVLYTQCVTYLRQMNPQLTVSQAEYLFLYCANGCRGIVERWVLSGCTLPPAQLAPLMTQLTLNGVLSFALDL